jgi:quinoprotein glucose dehydrogenase
MRSPYCTLFCIWLILSPLNLARAADWPCVGGDPGCQRWSELSEINRENVDQLEVAWVYHTREPDGSKPGRIECTPIVVDGVMYVTTGLLRVVALRADTGEQLWKFDPFASQPPTSPLASGGANRGLAYWSDGQPQGKRRVLHGTASGHLYSIDVRTGKLDPAFGAQGAKDLREDLQRDTYELVYGPTSAPAIFGDYVILGFSTGEGPGVSAPGDVRAFDVHTGKQVWRFHTVPRPGEFGNDTWQADSWKNRGGANAWGGFSIDPQRAMVFCGLGSASFDFYGGDRKGQNLFANCTLALDARTGKRIWHYQTLRHDLWDHDLPVYPNLVTVNHNGQQVDAAAQVTKTGYVFLFDRETGEPLFEINEQQVTASDVAGEQAWPTQPIPSKPPPFARQSMTEQDVTDIGEANRDGVLEQLREIRGGPAFNPPSREGTVVIPGFHGGANWSGASFDPTTGILYGNSTNAPNIMALEEAPPDARFRYRPKGYQWFVDHEGYPAIKPPWGELHAIDLNRGEYVWQVTLGEYPELTARGIKPTGTENFGGTIVTGGGLVFIAGTEDEKFRAFDKSTGKILWEVQLPAGGYATPCTYSVQGRQYVAIATGGTGKLGTPAGDAFVAFALPKR